MSDPNSTFTAANKLGEEENTVILTANAAPGSGIGNKDVVSAISASGGNGSGFNHLYNYCILPDANNQLILDVRNEKYKIRSTMLSNRNNYYRSHHWANGKSTAIAIVKNNVNDYADYKKRNNAAYRKRKPAVLFNNGSVLVNCVGWVNGRAKEIWAMAKKSGYIKYIDNKWVIPSKNNEEVPTTITTGLPSIPACNAKTFYTRWPTSRGYSKSDEGKDNKRPEPGAIICWGGTYYGHVAFVEAVYNINTPKEFIIISESAASENGASYIVQYRAIKRQGPNYKKNGIPYCYGDYIFRGFLFSPICKLSTVRSNLYEYDVNSTDISQEAKDAYAAASEALRGRNIIQDIPLNSKVYIQDLGNTKPDGTGKRVSGLDTIGTIIAKDFTQNYPYAFSVDGKTIFGYYTRMGIELYEDRSV